MTNYNDPRRSFKPRNRPDDGHRLFAIGLLIAVGLIVFFVISGVTK